MRLTVNTRTRTATTISLLAGLAGLTVLGALLIPGQVQGQSTSAGEEYLSVFEAVPPNVIFLVDLSDNMDEDCGPSDYQYGFDEDVAPILTASCAVSGCHNATTQAAGLNLSAAAAYSEMVGVASSQLTSMNLVEPGDSGNSYLWLKIEGTHAGVGGTGDSMPPFGSGYSLTAEMSSLIERWILIGAPETRGTTASGESCLTATLDAITEVSAHYDWARVGVVGTEGTSGATLNSYTPIVAVDATASEVASALSSVSSVSNAYRNPAEALSGLITQYLTRTTSTASTPSFLNAPIEYYCQETHIISVLSGAPSADVNASPTHVSASASLSPWDATCQNRSGAELCEYDNVVHHLYNTDLRADLAGTQNAVVHTIGIKTYDNEISGQLYGNASDVISNDGIYTMATSGEEITARIMTVMSYIRSGFYSRSAPIITADGSRLIYSFYEITGGNPLGKGHVRNFEIDTDPASLTYGQVLFNGPSTFGGALWDAGDLLVSRPVLAGEQQLDDRDGFGSRDIYTFVPEVMTAPSSTSAQEGVTEGRMSFDTDFTDALGASVPLLARFLDVSDTAYDLDGDGSVTSTDFQSLVDFSRGLTTATYRYLDLARGDWKLGDSPHSVPVVVDARYNNVFSLDPTYRAFLKELERQAIPSVVFIAANDGMLHAFRMEDDPLTTGSVFPGTTQDYDEAGEELWAWVLGYTLYQAPGEVWSGRLIDQMWYGRTFLFDGTPVVEDIWVDINGNGAKDCDPAMWTACEWKRVLVVQQGKGGPVTLALDITDTTAPKFLWEHVNVGDYYAQGYTVSTPVVANVYDASDPLAPHDRWVAFWGSGRAVPDRLSNALYRRIEPTLFMWAVEDDWESNPSTSFAGMSTGGQFATAGSNIGTEHPDYAALGSSLDTDSDGRMENGYISGAVTAVDVDSDGDVDVLYFPVSVTFEPSDQGDVDGDSTTGLSDLSDPGFTWMYKAVINTSTPDSPTWCEFYDPIDDGGLTARPEVYYSATASWHYDGSLGLYWGTGSPYSRLSGDAGYFFAVKDPSPLDCPASPTPILCQGVSGGYYALNGGEGLTGPPVVFDEVVYFPTYQPDADLCLDGVGRIYGLSYSDCSGAIDSDADGVADADYITVSGYPSGVTVNMDTRQLYFGTSDVANLNGLGSISPLADPFSGVTTMNERELF